MDGSEKAARGQALAEAGRRGCERLEAMPRVITSVKSELYSRRFEEAHRLAPKQKSADIPEPSPETAAGNLWEVTTVRGRRIKPLIGR